MKKQIIILFTSLLPAHMLFAQTVRFSLSTDFNIQRSFKKEQQYWAVGHTTHLLFNFTPKSGVYGWISYYSDGKFHNEVTAIAKSPSTIPQEIKYRNDANMRFKHFSLGYRRYLKGSFEADAKWNIYGYGGFGVMLGRVINSHTPFIDTSLYFVPVRSGKANFKRLTLDLGLGWEVPIGADFFFYTEARAWVPTTDYPSKYIFVNNNAPFTGMLNVGLRILFE